MSSTTLKQSIFELQRLDSRGVYVFSRQDLSKLFCNLSERAVNQRVATLVKSGILERASQGVFLFALAKSRSGRVIEDIAAVMRRGHYTYVTRESMLSEYGVISQVPVGRLTLMTTGAPGTYKTRYGVIEFTRTKRSVPELIHRTTTVEGRPLRIATKKAAIQDLVRSGRNVNMMDPEEMEN